jgi:flagellar biosynthesis regulator FlbT
MSTLVLELRQGDMMIVNGAPIRFRNRARIELTAKARFLFGKQLMTPDMADTPARRIYFALQRPPISAITMKERPAWKKRSNVSLNLRMPPRLASRGNIWTARWRWLKKTNATRR